MSCIKTGCTVLVKGLLYHGDLFLMGDELILKGVPKNSRHSSYGDESYFDNFNGQKYHCEAGSIEFLGEEASGYGRFAIFDGVVPQEDFYKFLCQWADSALPYFTKGN